MILVYDDFMQFMILVYDDFMKFIILIYLLFILHTSFPGISFTGLNVSKITGFDIAFSRLVLESYLGMKVSYLPYPDTSSMCAVCCLHKSIYII